MSAQPEASDLCPDIVEVRCQGGLHFKVVDGDTIEVKCKHCSDRETVVLHRYSWPDLKPIKTLRLKELGGRRARSPRKEDH